MAAKTKTVTTTETDPEATIDSPDSPDTVPPTIPVLGVPVKVVHINHARDKVLWQRLTLSFVGIAIVIFVWWWAIRHLYVLPEHSITAFTSITNNTLYTVACLVLFFVTGKILFDWKNQTTSAVVESAQHTFDTIKQDINSKSDNKNTNINLTGSVVHEGQDGAPDVRPFSQNANTK